MTPLQSLHLSQLHRHTQVKQLRGSCAAPRRKRCLNLERAHCAGALTSRDKRVYRRPTQRTRWPRPGIHQILSSAEHQARTPSLSLSMRWKASCHPNGCGTSLSETQNYSTAVLPRYSTHTVGWPCLPDACTRHKMSQASCLRSSAALRPFH